MLKVRSRVHRTEILCKPLSTLNNTALSKRLVACFICVFKLHVCFW